MEDSQEKLPANSPNQANQEVVNTKDATYALIAERVRADSINSKCLTSLNTVTPLISKTEKADSVVTGMLGTAEFQDIKLLVAADGARYLYSEKAITKRQAEQLAFGEEVRSQIVAQVRDDSKKEARLTPLTTISAMIPGAETEKIDGHLTLLIGNGRYKDIHLIADGEGNRYLYSEQFLTSNYAEILARAEMKDPYRIIAATVRSESRVYPRPTHLDTFNAPVFNVNPNDVRRFASEKERRPEYKDIKVIQASTGAVYFYSDLFLDSEWVKAIVEWEEVGKHLNP